MQRRSGLLLLCVCFLCRVSLAAEPPAPGSVKLVRSVQPVAANATALIRLTYVPGMNKESCPAIVCCGGRMDFHGAPLSRTWVKLGARATKGATEVTLAEPVTGWKVGDQVIVTATEGDGDTEKTTEPRTITAIDGTRIRFDVPLIAEHLGEGVNGVGPDARHPFVVRNTKIWNVHYGLRPQVPSLLVENMTIQTDYGIYHPNFDNHVYRNVTIRATNTEPFNRGHDDLSLQHGGLTVDGLTFDGCRSGGMPLIQISDDNDTGHAVSHFRHVEVRNWTDNSKQKAIINLGGGPRPQPQFEKGVPITLHDWFGPGRHAQVISIRSPEYKAHPDAYRAEPPLTGDESRVTDVSDIDFPQLLDPIDDLPPSTVILLVTPREGQLLVQGTCSDNNAVKRVLVNGQAARATTDNFATWEITLERSDLSEIIAHGEDEDGNVEQLSHTLTLAEFPVITGK